MELSTVKLPNAQLLGPSKNSKCRRRTNTSYIMLRSTSDLAMNAVLEMTWVRSGGQEYQGKEHQAR